MTREEFIERMDKVFIRFTEISANNCKYAFSCTAFLTAFSKYYKEIGRAYKALYAPSSVDNCWITDLVDTKGGVRSYPDNINEIRLTMLMFFKEHALSTKLYLTLGV